MAKPSSMNPLGYIIDRQIKDTVVVKNKLFKERLIRAKNLYRKDLFAHYGCVNAIEFSDEGELLVSGGDDRRVLLWSVPEAIHGKGAPVAMQTTHISNIFCLAFDSTNSKIFSGGNDDQVVVHDSRTGSFVVKLLHKKPVYGLSVNPQNDYVIATAGDDGRILMFDVREPSSTEPLCLAKQKTGFHSVMFNPFNPRLLATANSEEGIALWDYRKPKERLVHYDSNAGDVSGISVCFNSTGTRLLALRRRLPPVLYATQSQSAICQFYHPQYYNSCTMKTCCFAGDNDEYILSGSDDFNLYMWRVPKDDSEWGTAHVILRGHRSIVNQVRYNKHNNLIASSGVEKMVKLWSTLPVGKWEGTLLKEHSEVPRTVYSHDDYIYLVGHSGQRISHDYSDQSIQEDSRMMAFFDSLIQREIEGWDSPSEDSTFTTDSDSDEGQGRIRLSWESLLHSRRTTEENRKQKPNRIVQLIAQKRNRLARMAHFKSSSALHRYGPKPKYLKRRPSHKAKSLGSSNKYSKSNGVTTKKTHSKYTRSSSYVSNSDKDSRKHKLDVNKSEKWTRQKKCRTRLNYRETSESSASNSCIDIPSTSTGITNSSNSVFRVVEQDSDEDVAPSICTENGNDAEESFVNILPTPLNGTHDMCLNALDVNNHRSNGNVVALRNEDLASTSTTSIRNNLKHSGIENSCQTDDSCIDNDNENICVDDAYKSYINGDSCINSNFINESDSSECDFDYTPIKKRRNSDFGTPDSGFVTGPCTSGSTYTIRSSKHHLPCSSRSIGNSCNVHSSDENDFQFETFKKRVKKARVNIRKQIGGDSDSN